MNKQLPISLEAQFRAYTHEEKKTVRKDLWMFDYDGRHDFICNEDIAGIAVELTFTNERHWTDAPRGVRHRMTLTLVDTTLRCDVASSKVCICIPKDEIFYYHYADLPLASLNLKAGHSYKYVVHDDTASATLGEHAIHLFEERPQDAKSLSDWYSVDCAGIRPAWENALYKYTDAMACEHYYVRFIVNHGFGLNPPAIMPELEMRLHYPDGKRVDRHFAEPKYGYHGIGTCFVEQMFMAPVAKAGVFYAELLCMGRPIGGFVFTLSHINEAGAWHGTEITPLKNYTPRAAEARFNQLTGLATSCNDSTDNEEENEPDEFDEALTRFLSDTPSEEENAPEDEEEDMPDDEEDSEDNNDECDDTTAETDTDGALIPSLEHLTGLRAVKEKLRTYERVVRFNKMRSDSGLPVSTTPLHAMFLGSPGTGKTTVAKMMGLMLRRAGVLSKGHVVVRERANLLGQYYNSEGEKTLEAIEEAQGGILFIDEAYQLYQPNDARDPGKFVIETLLTALADSGKRDWMLILAGYPDEMLRMFDMNPGFKSRIPSSNIYRFDDFSECELMEIAENYLAKFSYTMTPDAHSSLSTRLGADYSARDKTFGNARHVINLIQTEILPAMAVRVTSEACPTERSLTEIQASDIPQPLPDTTTSRPRIGFAV